MGVRELIPSIVAMAIGIFLLAIGIIISTKYGVKGTKNV